METLVPFVVSHGALGWGFNRCCPKMRVEHLWVRQVLSSMYSGACLSPGTSPVSTLIGLSLGSKQEKGSIEACPHTCSCILSNCPLPPTQLWDELMSCGFLC